MTEKDHEHSIPTRIRKKGEKQEEVHVDSLPAFNVSTGECCGGHHIERCSGHYGKCCYEHHGERCGGHYCPPVVKDSDDVIFAIRSDVPSTLIDTLRCTNSLLPRGGGRSTKRGQYSTRHSALWCDYSRTPYISTELLDNGNQVQEWLARNSRLFQSLCKRPISMHCFLPQCSPWCLPLRSP